MIPPEVWAALGAALVAAAPVGFFVALMAVGLWAASKADATMAATFVILVVNCLAGWAAVLLTGSKMPLIPMVFIDSITAALILWFARRDEQVLIGILLFVQVGIHIGTFITGAPPQAQPLYSNAINVIGWGQILLLTIGTHNGPGKRLRVVAAICRHFGLSARPAFARAPQR